VVNVSLVVISLLSVHFFISHITSNAGTETHPTRTIARMIIFTTSMVCSAADGFMMMPPGSDDIDFVYPHFAVPSRNKSIKGYDIP
jgi:hypothetical protein